MKRALGVLLGLLLLSSCYCRVENQPNSAENQPQQDERVVDLESAKNDIDIEISFDDADDEKAPVKSKSSDGEDDTVESDQAEASPTSPSEPPKASASKPAAKIVHISKTAVIARGRPVLPTSLKLGLDRVTAQRLAVTKAIEAEMATLISKPDLLTKLDDVVLDKIKEELTSKASDLLPPEVKEKLMKAGKSTEMLKTTLSHLNKDSLRHLVLEHAQAGLTGLIKKKVMSNPQVTKLFNSRLGQHAKKHLSVHSSKYTQVKIIKSKLQWVSSRSSHKKLDTKGLLQSAKGQAGDMVVSCLNKHVFTNEKVVRVLEQPMVKDIAAQLGVDLGKWTAGGMTKAHFKNDIIKAQSQLLKIKAMKKEDIKKAVINKSQDVALGQLNKQIMKSQKAQKILNNSKVKKVGSLIGLDTSKVASGQLTKEDIATVHKKIKGHIDNVKNIKKELNAIKADPTKAVKHVFKAAKYITKNNPKAQAFLRQLEEFNNPNMKFCWKKSYGRGAGTVPQRCRSGKQKQAGLCYHHCRGGFSGVGPVCWKQCPGGFRNHGLTCYKSWRKWHFKKTYGRGAGSVPTECNNGKENKAGLCYHHCRGGFYGVGPVCWQHCQGETPYNCGAACGSSTMACARRVYDMVKGVLLMIKKLKTLSAGVGGSSAIKSSAKAALTAGVKMAKEFTKKHLNKETFVKFMKSKTQGKNSDDSLSKLYDESTKFDTNTAVENLKGVDPTGIAEAVVAFLHSKC